MIKIDKILAEKEDGLKKLFYSLRSLAIAFSGGVDSSLLAALAKRYIKGKVLLVNAQTTFGTEKEALFVKEWTKENGYDLEVIKIDVLKFPEIKKNPPNRCYYCKKVLIEKIKIVAESHGIKTVADGSNMDDLTDYRPGHKAAEELGVIHPFMDAQITKEEIRKLARKYKLEHWNTPAQACLATRIPANTPILNEDLRKIEKAEDYLHNLGFLGCRVRKLGNMAKIEVLQNQIADLLLCQGSIVDALKKFGFQQVVTDPEGYKQGAMNFREIL